MKSKVIAISAISAGFIAIVLTVGAYLEFADIFCLIMSSVFVLLPLYFNSYAGSFLGFLAGGIIALLFSGFNFLSLIFPCYFVFFGCYPLVVWFMRNKMVKEKISFLIGLIWCIAFCYGAYFYYTLVMNFNLDNLPEFLGQYILYFLPVIATVFYAIYHRFIFVIKFWLDRYLQRIVK